MGKEHAGRAMAMVVDQVAAAPGLYRIAGRQTLTHQVLERLTDLIVEGQLPAGATLPPENDLAAEFGVSRTVVREAVRILAAQGLVEVRHGAGTFVHPPHAWRVDEPLALLLRATEQSLLRWLEVRTMLEVAAAPLAAERATESDRAVLAEALAVMRSQLAHEVPQPETSIRADIRFHLGVAAATQNPLLMCVLRPVLAPLADSLREAWHLPGSAVQAVQEHEAILDRIAAHDAPGSEAAMRLHLARVAREIDELLRRRGAAAAQ